MGFALKKFIASLLMPIPLLLIVALLGLLFLYKKRYTQAKFFFVGATLMMLLFSNEVVSNAYIYPLEKQYKKFEQNKEYQYIFVLGSGHDDSIDTPLSSHLSQSAIKRISEGVILLRQNPDAKIVFSGYGGRSDKSHAMVAASFAQALGVPKDRIIMFSQPQDTAEEAKLFQEKIAKQDFILVTSATHMMRAMAIFEKLDLNPTPAPTDFLSQHHAKWYRFGAQNIKKIEIATHEYLGILWYKMRGYI